MHDVHDDDEKLDGVQHGGDDGNACAHDAHRVGDVCVSRVCGGQRGDDDDAHDLRGENGDDENDEMAYIRPLPFPQ